jgi:16S rRNA processing protein RimM
MEYTEIGRINKPHGLNGEMKATIDERFYGDVAEIDAFFVDEKAQKTPYFIEYMRGRGSLILKFEDIETKEEARVFTNKYLYLRRDDISLTEEEINDTGLEYSFLQGYELHEEAIGKIGMIELIEEFPQQEMATVNCAEKTILIPLLEQWITSVDKSAKVIIMSLPEGLLDM